MKYRLLCNGSDCVWPSIAISDLKAVDCVSNSDGMFETADINLVFQYIEFLNNLSTTAHFDWKFEIKEVDCR